MQILVDITHFGGVATEIGKKIRLLEARETSSFC